MNTGAVAGFIAKYKKFIVIAAIAGIIIYAFTSGSHKKGKDDQAQGKGNISNEERLKADIEGLKKKIDQMEKGKGGTKVEEPEKGKNDGKTPPAVSPLTEKTKEKPESLKELEKALKPTPRQPLPNAGVPGSELSPNAAMPIRKPEPPRLLKIDVSEAPRDNRKEIARQTQDQSNIFLASRIVCFHYHFIQCLCP